jgi:hypothetical protein
MLNGRCPQPLPLGAANAQHQPRPKAGGCMLKFGFAPLTLLPTRGIRSRLLAP